MRVNWSSCRWTVQGEMIEREKGTGTYIGSVVINNSVHAIVASDNGDIFDVPVRYMTFVNSATILNELTKQAQELGLYDDVKNPMIKVHNEDLKNDNNTPSSQSQGAPAGKVHKG